MSTNPTGTRQDRTAELVANLMDGDRVVLICDIHHYTPGGENLPGEGCQKCIMCYYVWMFANTPKEKQREDFERFEGLIHAMCELDDEGKFDISLRRHPILTIEKDALPDA